MTTEIGKLTEPERRLCTEPPTVPADLESKHCCHSLSSESGEEFVFRCRKKVDENFGIA